MCRKDENKEKEAVNGPFKKDLVPSHLIQLCQGENSRIGKNSKNYRKTSLSWNSN